jgi:cytochrome c oxidase cbb3-type subunit 2
MATGHEKVETNIGLMIILVILVVSIGGLVQIVPLFFMHSMTEPVEGLKPYPALELAGRDVYVREGCFLCHSQMIRPFRAETERYGHYSVAGEFVYDRPFQWGSKRTGPDLHRVGGRYSDEWHYAHLINPRDVVPESVMPGYPSFVDNKIDGKLVQHKMQVLKDWYSHPYTDEEIANAPNAVKGKTEMDAVIAYLQNMGTALKKVR